MGHDTGVNYKVKGTIGLVAMQAKLPTTDEIDYNHVWSEVDDKMVPVDPADCDACQGISPNPCFNHYCMGAEFNVS